MLIIYLYTDYTLVSIFSKIKHWLDFRINWDISITILPVRRSVSFFARLNVMKLTILVQYHRWNKKIFFFLLRYPTAKQVPAESALAWTFMQYTVACAKPLHRSKMVKFPVIDVRRISSLWISQARWSPAGLSSLNSDANDYLDAGICISCRDSEITDQPSNFLPVAVDN